MKYKRLFISILLLTLSHLASAQKFPDLPIQVNFDLGFNQLNNMPTETSLDFWGSRAANFQFVYEHVLWNEHFTLNAGVGMRVEN